MSEFRTSPAARSSLSHPLHIATLDIGRSGGAVGVTFAPGKKQRVAMTGRWDRDLSTDLLAIRQWGAKELITLLEPAEFGELGISTLPAMAKEHGLLWHGLPIRDGSAPDERFLAPWAKLGPRLISRIGDGERVVVHCKGGLGRAGTVACLILLSSGSAKSAADAIGRVRSVRPGAVETVEQEEFIQSWALQLNSGLRS